MMNETENSFRTVRFYKAPDDGRVVGIFISSDFDEYEKFPPFVKTEEEREHILKAYETKDPALEISSKAHITDDEWPLQVILISREVGSKTKPHYHRNIRAPDVKTRHEIIMCQSGLKKVGVYTWDGKHLGDAILKPGDLIILAEGHSTEVLEKNTKTIEIKQGPFPVTDAADKEELGVPP